MKKIEITSILLIALMLVSNTILAQNPHQTPTNAISTFSIPPAESMVIHNMKVTTHNWLFRVKELKTDRIIKIGNYDASVLRDIFISNDKLLVTLDDAICLYSTKTRKMTELLKISKRPKKFSKISDICSRLNNKTLDIKCFSGITSKSIKTKKTLNEINSDHTRGLLRFSANGNDGMLFSMFNDDNSNSYWTSDRQFDFTNVTDKISNVIKTNHDDAPTVDKKIWTVKSRIGNSYYIGPTSDRIMNIMPIPLSIADYIAQKHDIAYVDLEISGIRGSFNHASGPSNAQLILDCEEVMRLYDQGVRTYKGYPLDKKTYNTMRIMKNYFSRTGTITETFTDIKQKL